MKFIFFYTAVLFFAFSCKKSDHPCEGKYKDSYTTISSYFGPYQFKEGTYWVYQNDATAQIDSQRVVSAIDTKIGSGGGSSCGSTYAQLYTMDVHRSLTDDYFEYFIITSCFMKNTDHSALPNGTCILSSSDIQQAAAISSMTINGHTFSNVRKVSVGQFYYYFVDSVGLVKWEKLYGSSIIESWGIQAWEVFL